MNWSYLAGFTDGDGCITREFSRGKYAYARIRWSQKQTDSQVLHEIMDFLRKEGIKVTERNFSVARSGHRFPQVELGISNADDTRKVLTEILPYLVVKRARAEEALGLLNAVSALKKTYGWKYRIHLARVS